MQNPFGEVIQRDLERLGAGFPRGLPALPLPASSNGSPGTEPKSPPELLQRLPGEISMTAQTGLNLLGQLPTQLAEDLTVALDNLIKLPREVTQELFLTPGQLSQRLAPSNINQLLATVRESANFKDAINPRQAREKLRTITDVIDLFTPT